MSNAGRAEVSGREKDSTRFPPAPLTRLQTIYIYFFSLYVSFFFLISFFLTLLLCHFTYTLWTSYDEETSFARFTPKLRAWRLSCLDPRVLFVTLRIISDASQFLYNVLYIYIYTHIYTYNIHLLVCIESGCCAQVLRTSFCRVSFFSIISGNVSRSESIWRRECDVPGKHT